MKKLLLLILLLTAGSKASIATCNADFWSNPLVGGPPAVAFINMSTGDTTGGPLTYHWDFGDGMTDVTANPIHTFPLWGVFNTCLIVTDWTGCSDTTCILTNLTPPPPVLNGDFYTDSLSLYACTAPSAVTYFYYIVAQNFLPQDSVFNVHVTFGDGTDTSWTYSGANTGTQGIINHSYLNAGNYTAQFTVTCVSNQVSLTSTAQQVVVASNCGTVTGSVYNDLNNNCIFDVGEELENIVVVIYDGTTLAGWTQTDATGAYSFNVPVGINYVVSVQPNNGYFGIHTPTCPTSGTLTITSVPSTGNNFGVECPPGADLTGIISAWRFRPGFTETVCVNAYNVRCSTPNGTIEITVDPLLTPQPDVNGIGYTVSGQTVTFPISSPELNWNFCFPVVVSLNAIIGDSVCIDLNIIVPNDSVPSNNASTYCYQVRGSYDPNDKNANPAGEGSQGFILPNTPLDYTIRFQNTGNDTAYNVFILDTLDANLDLLSLEVLGASHPFTYSVLSGNILRFNFDNILLADSNTNEAASHGYIVYRINQVSNIAQSAEIRNMASIFFDFNAPIYTNTTLHTIDYFLSVPSNVVSNNFSVFPNPAYDKCVVRFNDNKVKTISLIDALGKEVFRSNATSHLEINTSEFANGIYTIRVEDGTTTNNSKLIIGVR